MGFEDANRGYLYYDGKIFNDKVVSYELIVGSRHYWREMRVVNVPQGAYVSICSTDLVRLLDRDSEFAVPDDNLRVPGGFSYMLATVGVGYISNSGSSALDVETGW